MGIMGSRFNNELSVENNGYQTNSADLAWMFW